MADDTKVSRVPGGARDLFGSERGIFCVALLFAATVLVILGKLDGATWIDFMKYLAVTLVASKTVTTAVRTFKQPPAGAVPPPAPLA